MTEHDPIQRALDGATLTVNAFQGGQLDALHETLRNFEALTEDLKQRIGDIDASRETSRSFEAFTEDLKQRIRDIEARRSAGLFHDPQR